MANKIKKIKLSNGEIYSIFDNDAIHYETKDGNIVMLTGNTVVDNVILNDGHFIIEIDDTNVAVGNLLTVNTSTGKIEKRDAAKVLEDIGGCSYNMNDSTQTLSLKIGKQ